MKNKKKSVLIATIMGFIGFGGLSSCGKSETEPSPSLQTYTVTVVADAGGTITPDSEKGGTVVPASAEVAIGKTASFSFTPNKGFALGEVKGCSGSLQENTYTTGKIVNDCTVTVRFNRLYDVITEPFAGGSISPSSSQVPQGEKGRFTINADSGYFVQSVSGCNGHLFGNTYVTGEVFSTCVISARFLVETANVNRINVSATAGAGGVITPSYLSVRPGSRTTLTIVADKGYEVNNVSGCDGELSNNLYTTNFLREDCVIAASFMKISGASAQ